MIIGMQFWSPILYFVLGREIFVNGEKVCYGQNKTNRYIGYLPDVPAFYGYMTPVEYLTFCDEPTSALDPAGRKEILDILLAVVGVYVGCYLLSLFPKLTAYMPTRLLSAGELLSGAGTTGDFLKTILVTCVSAVVAVGLGVAAFNRSEVV